MKYSPLTVLDIREEIGGQAKTVIFEVSDWDTWNWKAGQHLPIKLMINGEEVRRSYSISASPDTEDGLRITVKRVKGGLVSNHINDHIQPGDVIEAAVPNGQFTLEPGDTKRRTHYFFGAGSGITPLYAMLSSVVAAEPWSTIHLAYGNNNEQSILLDDEINAMWEAAADRMTVHHIFSNPGWWSASDYWRKGRIDQAAIEALFAENPPYAQDAQYYICGPGGMNKAVKQALMALDVPASRIHMESYGGAAELDTSFEGMASEVALTLNGATHTIDVAAGQTILKAAQTAGLTPPFSCQSGVCGTCRAKRMEGDIHLRSRAALDDTDIANGVVLTCQALPISERVSISYD
ncbi:MAG: ketosteroid-9-alpha-hydroxylase [Alphaproteobacteria bacterium]|nr:MAG: ketosteroid-9-alpha-hydroxylase [Alphaproteobacteria bacterium]